MKRIMIAGTRSGCGKTTVSCALLQALKNRDTKVAAFKCGPDYIDPMFHKTVIGADSYNLDSYLMPENTIRFLLRKNGGDIALIEGVMGFYDGLSFTSRASSHEIAKITDTPVILVADCGGASLSALAAVKGFMEFRDAENDGDTKIKGVIFNNLAPRLYGDMARESRKRGIEPLGFLPKVRDAEIKSRHLGLVTAAEIAGLKEKMLLLADLCEKYIDVERILEIASLSDGDTKIDFPKIKRRGAVKIAAARDTAFCFYYEDNFNLLRELGAEIVFFSPLKNERVPECDGLILGGGYPELHADILEKNTVTLNSVKGAIAAGTPCIAECGGFMYLHDVMEDGGGTPHKMAGVIRGRCFKTEKLRRFGYMEMTARSDNILCKRGHKIRSREFHYFDSDDCGNGFDAEKNGVKRSCVHTEGNIFAGFPHIHFYSDISLAENFIESCEKYKCTKSKQ